MFQPNTDTAGRRYEQPAIYNPNPSTAGMMGVWLHEDEEVDWTIGCNPDGSQHCYGYTIRKKGQTIHQNEIKINPIDPDLFRIEPIQVK